MALFFSQAFVTTAEAQTQVASKKAFDDILSAVNSRLRSDRERALVKGLTKLTTGTYEERGRLVDFIAQNISNICNGGTQDTVHACFQYIGQADDLYDSLPLLHMTAAACELPAETAQKNKCYQNVFSFIRQNPIDHTALKPLPYLAQLLTATCGVSPSTNEKYSCFVEAINSTKETSLEKTAEGSEEKYALPLYSQAQNNGCAARTLQLFGSQRRQAEFSRGARCYQTILDNAVTSHSTATSSGSSAR